MTILKQSIFIFLLGILCFNLHAATDTTPLLDEGGRPSQISMVAVSVVVSETTGEKEYNAAVEYLRTKGLDENTTDLNYLLYGEDLYNIFTPFIEFVASTNLDERCNLPALVMLERVLSTCFRVSSDDTIFIPGFRGVAQDGLKMVFNRRKILDYLLSRPELSAARRPVYTRVLNQLQTYEDAVIDTIRINSAPCWPYILCLPCFMLTCSFCGKSDELPCMRALQKSPESIREEASNSTGVPLYFKEKL